MKDGLPLGKTLATPLKRYKVTSLLTSISIHYVLRFLTTTKKLRAIPNLQFASSSGELPVCRSRRVFCAETGRLRQLSAPYRAPAGAAPLDSSAGQRRPCLPRRDSRRDTDVKVRESHLGGAARVSRSSPHFSAVIATEGRSRRSLLLRHLTNT